MGCWTLMQGKTVVTSLVEGTGAAAAVHPEEIRLKPLSACSELLWADPGTIAVGLGRELEARLRVEEPGIAEHIDPYWGLLGKTRLRIHEGTTRSQETASWAAAAAAEVSGQRFESYVASVAVVWEVESSYDRRWAVRSHLVENRRCLWQVDLFDRATGEDEGS